WGERGAKEGDLLGIFLLAQNQPGTREAPLYMVHIWCDCIGCKKNWIEMAKKQPETRFVYDDCEGMTKCLMIREGTTEGSMHMQEERRTDPLTRRQPFFRFKYKAMLLLLVITAEAVLSYVSFSFVQSGQLAPFAFQIAPTLAINDSDRWGHDRQTTTPTFDF